MVRPASLSPQQTSTQSPRRFAAFFAIRKKRRCSGRLGAGLLRRTITGNVLRVTLANSRYLSSKPQSAGERLRRPEAQTSDNATSRRVLLDARSYRRAEQAR